MKRVKREPIACSAARTRDEELLMQSSSGGAFSELAKVVLADGGVVFGAAWEPKTFRVVHQWVDNTKDLAKLRGSKYSVSDLSDVYGPMRTFLEEGRKVLFTGTPCQTAAMRKAFGNDPNLILCALICMSNADASIWAEYLKELREKAGCAIKSISHRHKGCGQTGARFTVEFEDSNKNISESLYSNEYWGRFSRSPRLVCQNCPFRAGGSAADIQIGDFWGVENVRPMWGDGKGASAVLIFTERGQTLFSRTALESYEVDYRQILSGNPYLEQQYRPSAPARLSAYRRIRHFLGRIVRKVGLK